MASIIVSYYVVFYELFDEISYFPKQGTCDDECGFLYL